MLEKEIIKLGLSDKEAKVYLAALELGRASVQNISQKSKVNRATTYVIIDSLMEMGLMSTYDERKKTLFMAERPERLLDYLKNQEGAIKSKIKILEEKIPELKMIFGSKDKPVVKYYEGVEGLKSVQLDFIETLKEGDAVLTFLPYDEYFQSDLVFKLSEQRKKRLSKNIRMKVLYSSKEGRQLEYEKIQSKDLKEYRYIDYKLYPFQGGMNIYGNKIFFIDYLGKTGGVVIENKTIAQMMTALFNLAWNMCGNK